MSAYAHTRGMQAKLAGRRLTKMRAHRALPCIIAAFAVAVALAAFSPAGAWAASPNKADISTATTKITIVQDSLDNKWDYDGSHITTRYRWNGKKDTGNFVYCISPGVAHGPFEGESKAVPARLLRASDFKSNALYEACLAALYYAPGGPGYETDEGTTSGLIGRKLFPDQDYKGGGFSKKDRFGCAHTLMGFYYNDISWGKTYPRDNWQPADSFKKWFTKEMIPARWGGSGSSSYGQRALDHFNDQDMLENGGYTVEAWKDSVYLLMTGDDESLQDLLTFEDAPRGPIKLEKKSADAGITDGNPCYSLKGAEYTIYSDSGLKHKIATIITDANGKAELEAIVTGTYYVKETAPSKGFKLDPTVYAVKVKKDVGGSFTSKEEPIVNVLDMLAEKDGMGESDGIPQGEAKLEGAEFAISYYAGQYSDSNLPAEATRTWVLKTNDRGKIPVDELQQLKVSGPDFFMHDGKVVFPLGTVSVQETKAPVGYQLADDEGNAPQNHIVNITEDTAKHTIAKAYATPKQEDAPKRIGLRIWKIDEMLGIPQAQGDASLEGAEFSVVNKSAHSVKVNGEFYAPDAECLVVTTKKTTDGFVAEALAALPYGNYAITEKNPPEGYLPNTEWSAEISVDEATEHGAVFDFAENKCADMVKRGGIRVPKIDRELGEALPLGAATLEGAEFTIRLDSQQPVVVDGALFKPGEDVKAITTNDKGIAETGEHDLPYGTYTVRETKAPTGYALNADWSETVEVREDGKVYETKQADDQVIRGDVRFNKVHEDTMARLGCIPFLVTSKTTGEKHVLVADENGNLDSSAAWAKHTASTNANDHVLEASGAAESKRDDDTPEDASPVDSESGQDQEGDAEASSGEPPESASSEGSDTDDSTQDDAGTADTPTSGSDDSGNPSDDGTHPDDGSASANGGNASSGIDVGKLLKAIAFALDADSATVDSQEDLVKRIQDAGVHADVNFTATLRSGTETSTRELIATLQDDDSVVVRDADTDDEIAVLDPSEDNQHSSSETASSSESGDTPHPSSSGDADEPDPSESSSDSESGDGGSTDENQAATDADAPETGPDNPAATEDDDAEEHSSNAIDTSSLDPHAGIWFNGRTDKTTQADDALGALPYDTYTFQELRCDANAGLKLVDFEVNISRHSYDIDLGTVDDKPISLNTELKTETGTHVAPATEAVKLVDEVTCVNVKPGESYELVGTLVDKETGDQVGDAVKQGFAAEKSTQKVDVAFEVDTSALDGHSLVAYQELYENGTLVAEHKDIDDADETVSIPRIRTTLTDKGGAKELKPAEATKLTDRVDFEGLEPHHMYTLKAALHAKSEDGGDLGVAKDAAGNDICAEAAFEPQTQSGSTVVEFSFDASAMDACSLVAFEELYIGDILLASHADISDESQTVSLTPDQPEPTPMAPPANEPPTPADSYSTPAKGGGSYDKTGDTLHRYWMALLALSLFCAIVWPCALFERKPAYASWGPAESSSGNAGAVEPFPRGPRPWL